MDLVQPGGQRRLRPYRLNGDHRGAGHRGQSGLRLVAGANALPVKFRAGELNARASEVGVEELHIVHEGLYAA
ncbi:MAG: phage tail protein [Candidatus Moduliflexus flocculans]|nr:phage tail protein [Candidatus Moduliflexus flocculans]